MLAAGAYLGPSDEQRRADVAGPPHTLLYLFHHKLLSRSLTRLRRHQTLPHALQVIIDLHIHRGRWRLLSPGPRLVSPHRIRPAQVAGGMLAHGAHPACSKGGITQVARPASAHPDRPEDTGGCSFRSFGSGKQLGTGGKVSLDEPPHPLSVLLRRVGNHEGDWRFFFRGISTLARRWTG